MTVYKRAVELMEAELGDELVALDPKGGHCFGFNSVATAVWRELEAPKSFEQLHSALIDQFEVGSEQCSRELRLLLDDLSAKGLVAPAS